MNAQSDLVDAARPLVDVDDQQEIDMFDLLVGLAAKWRLLLLAPLAATALAFCATYLVDPIYTARTTILPPASQPSASAGALAALSGLGALAGGALAVRSPTEQLVALLQSETVADRLIDRFELMKLYDEKLRREARRILRSRSHIGAGRKDGLIGIEVDDTDPKRAAAIANQYVEELRRLSSTLAVTEAQQRRAFFQSHLEATRDELVRAQRALQASGFDAGALRAEPRAAGEEYARVKAETTAAEVRLQALSARLTTNTPEVQQAQSTLAALRAKLGELERATAGSKGADYIGRFREFKYRETLFDLFARQYELARVDESREGALIQVVDPALVPEWKSRPRRAVIAAVAGGVALVVLALILVARRLWFGQWSEAWRRARAGRQGPPVARNVGA